MTTQKAIFIDKDGTLIKDIPYNVDVHQVEFNEGVVDALKRLRAAGFLLIVVSNQSGVARGFFDMEDLKNLKDELNGILKEQGVEPDAWYFCPHHPKGVIKPYDVDCNCRKPSPGMILDAAKNFGIDVAESWMIGDILNDVEAGNRAGCKTILVNNGNETEWVLTEERQPTAIVSSFPDGVEIIIHQCQLA
jgi:D-glycero-D-manno-heptose 1,7-bisphosphate phosphatase